MFEADSFGAALAEYLRNQPHQACFSTEAAVRLGLGVDQVEQHLQQLRNDGDVWLEELSPGDPHLPRRMLVVASIDRQAPKHEALLDAQVRAYKVFDSWLREMLAFHRCS